MSALRPALISLGVLLAAGGGLLAARGSSPAAASMAGHEMAEPAARAAPACRQGAFLEASSIINSVVDIALSLPQGTPERTRKELDTVLYTALGQAKSEVHCVAGALEHGYGRSFAEIVRRGADLARMRGLPKGTVADALAVAEALERNAPVKPGKTGQRAAGARP